MRAHPLKGFTQSQFHFAIIVEGTKVMKTREKQKYLILNIHKANQTNSIWTKHVFAK